MATLQEAFEAARCGKVVSLNGQQAKINPNGVMCWRKPPGRAIHAGTATLDGWTIEEPKPQTEDWPIHPYPHNGQLLYAFDHNVPTYLWFIDADTRKVGYVFDELEDLPDNELPQQLRVWVCTDGRAIDEDMYPAWLPFPPEMAEGLTIALGAVNSNLDCDQYELRTAKAVRMRKEA